MGYKSLLITALVLISTSAENSTISELDSGDTCEIGPWSEALVEWATLPHEENHRHGRVMTLAPSTGYYVSERIDNNLTPPPPPPVRAYSEWPEDKGTWGPPPPHHFQAPQASQQYHQPTKIVNRPPYKDQFKPSYPPPRPPVPPQHPPRPAGDRVDEQPQNNKQVSETDLYLLGAIEKLVYRVDLMEKRLRRMEESMHLLIADSDPKPDPCPQNFTRVGKSCYHFSSELADWKSANLACRHLRASLLELGSVKERYKVFAALQASKDRKDSDWWTSGLNPGLLWIWSGSARPVVENNATVTSNATQATPITIVGEGRCLSLVYDPAAKTHVYRGQDCGLKHRFVCEKEEDKTKLSNEIERVSRALRQPGKGRKPKIVWSEDE